MEVPSGHEVLAINFARLEDGGCVKEASRAFYFSRATVGFVDELIRRTDGAGEDGGELAESSA